MKRGFGWPLGVVAILAATVGLNIYVYRVATDDDVALAIEPDYYQKAIDWDSTMAQMRRNMALGWHVSPTLGAFTVKDGAPLQVTVTDSAGAKIDGATVKVSAFYNAAANNIVDTTLTADASGYVGRLPVNHIGVWELRFDVKRGAERFTSIARVDAVAAAAGPGT